MYSPEINLTSASIARALLRMERIFQQEAAHTAKLHYVTEIDSDLSVYAHFIQENTAILGQIPLATKNLNSNEIARKRFFDILRRAAKAHDGISRQERLFVQQFWSLCEQVKV